RDPGGQLLAGQCELRGFGQVVLCVHTVRRRRGTGHREPRPVLHGAPFDVRLPLPDQPVSALAGQVAVQAVEVSENDHLHDQLPSVLIGWPRRRSSSSRLASSWSISASCSSAASISADRSAASVGSSSRSPIRRRRSAAVSRERVKSSSTSLSCSASASVLMAGCLLPPAALPLAALPLAALPLAVEAGTEA